MTVFIFTSNKLSTIATSIRLLFTIFQLSKLLSNNLITFVAAIGKSKKKSGRHDDRSYANDKVAKFESHKISFSFLTRVSAVLDWPGCFVSTTTTLLTQLKRAPPNCNEGGEM